MKRLILVALVLIVAAYSIGHLQGRERPSIEMYDHFLQREAILKEALYECD